MKKTKVVQQDLSSIFGGSKVNKKIDEAPTKNSGVTLFSYLKDITYLKTGKVPEQGDYEMKNFDTYMILRYLSMDKNYLPLINIFNQYQGTLTKKQMYQALLVTIPKSRIFLNYPKLIKQQLNGFTEEDLRLLKNYYECPRRDVVEYVERGFISKSELDDIKLKYGGKEK